MDNHIKQVQSILLPYCTTGSKFALTQLSKTVCDAKLVPKPVNSIIRDLYVDVVRKMSWNNPHTLEIKSGVIAQLS